MLIVFKPSPNSQFALDTSVLIVREETLPFPNNFVKQCKMSIVDVDKIHRRAQETLEFNFEIGQPGQRGQRVKFLIKLDSDIPIACFGGPAVGSRAEKISLSDPSRLQFGYQFFHSRIVAEAAVAVDDRNRCDSQM